MNLVKALFTHFLPFRLLLSSEEDGAFFLRLCSESNGLVLSFLSNSHLFHTFLDQNEDVWSLGLCLMNHILYLVPMTQTFHVFAGGLPTLFGTVMDMIHYYQQHPIYKNTILSKMFEPGLESERYN